MDSTRTETTEGEILIRCLMCWELKEPDDFLRDALYRGNSYCKTCDVIQRAHTAAHLRVMFDWTASTPPYAFLVDGQWMGQRWRDYVIEYLYGSLYAALTQRAISSPERYRGPDAPLLDDGAPLVWRIRLFHTQRRGYAEGWWNPQMEQWEWSLQKIGADVSVAEWREWRKAIRDIATVGRPLGTALIYLTSVDAFLARLQDVVSERGWTMALPGTDAITRKQVRQRVRAGRVTQAQLGEILGCDRRTIARALARFKEEKQLDWTDLRQRLAEWSREL